MIKMKLLLAEDEIEQSEIYQKMLTQLGYDVYLAGSKERAMEHLQKHAINILVTDIHLTNSLERNSFEGFDLLQYAKLNHPECCLIAMSNDQKVNTYHKALEHGALSYIKKPVFSADEFQLAILGANERKEFNRLKAAANEDCKTKDDHATYGLVLADDTRENAYLLAEAKELPCIIFGETGTGKEEIAKLIHKRRVEVEGSISFVAVNCAGLDSATASSHLFGHRRGSFTGADATTIGYVGEANGGILFLDEIHSLSIENQRKLLRVLNDGTYQRFGDTKTLHSEFQVIVATGKNLDDLVDRGEFLPDLRSRITGIMINLKPLRERLDDMNLLVPLIFGKLKATVSDGEMKAIIERCKTFYWQDNIRQLYNTLKATTITCQCKKRPITASDLQIYPSMLAPNEQHNFTTEQAEQHRIMDVLAKDYDFSESVEHYERFIIRAAINRHREKIGKIVEGINIPRSTFDAKRKKFGLEC